MRISYLVTNRSIFRPATARVVARYDRYITLDDGELRLRTHDHILVLGRTKGFRNPRGESRWFPQHLYNHNK